MMKVIAGLDPNSMQFCVTIISPLMEKYYTNFTGMLKSDKDCPQGLSIIRENLETIHLQFPAPPDAVKSKEFDGKIAVDKDSVEGMQNVLSIANRFVVAALKYKLKHTEFLPFLDFSGGYSFEEMQKDVVEAIKAKRDFNLIDTYKNYLDNMKTLKYEFNQYPVKYGTDEYADIVLLIKSGNLKELQATYKDKLKFTSWT
jgi:hypothetical protein